MKRDFPFTSILWLAGLTLLYLGRRVLLEESTANWSTLIGLALIAIALLKEGRAVGRTEDPLTRGAHRTIALGGVIGLLGILFCALTTEHGLWPALLGASWPILLLISTLIVVMVDLAHTSSSIVVQPARIRHVRDTAILIGLAIALVFPINYIAIQKNKSWDLSYFKTATPSSATSGLVKSLPQPVTVRIFQEPGQRVTEELKAYFKPLVGPTLTLEVLDQAAVPALSKQLNVSGNELVSISLDPTDQDDPDAAPLTTTFPVPAKWQRAKSVLKQLDATFHSKLAEASSGKRIVYVTQEHGELQLKPSGRTDQSMNSQKKALENKGFSLKPLNRAKLAEEGVPADASAVAILGAKTEFWDAEVAALGDYLTIGGTLLITLEPYFEEPAYLAPVLDLIGVEQEAGLVAHDGVGHFYPRSGNLNMVIRPDLANILVKPSSSHPMASSWREYGKSYGKIPVFKSSSFIQNTDFEGKFNITLRSDAKSWLDVDKDFKKTNEKRSSRNLAVAITAEEKDGGWKAIVIGSTDVLSDKWNRRLPQFPLSDSVAWLVGAEEQSGLLNNEEDIRIVHKTEDDLVWFYGTVIVVPSGIFLLGLLRLRRRKRGADVIDGGAA